MMRKLNTGEEWKSYTIRNNTVLTNICDDYMDVWVDENGFQHTNNEKPSFILYFDLRKKKIKRICHRFHGKKNNPYDFAYVDYRKDGLVNFKEYWLGNKVMKKDMWLIEREKSLLELHRERILDEIW